MKAKNNDWNSNTLFLLKKSPPNHPPFTTHPHIRTKVEPLHSAFNERMRTYVFFCSFCFFVLNHGLGVGFLQALWHSGRISRRKSTDLRKAFLDLLFLPSCFAWISAALCESCCFRYRTRTVVAACLLHSIEMRNEKHYKIILRLLFVSLVLRLPMMLWWLRAGLVYPPRCHGTLWLKMKTKTFAVSRLVL